MNKLTRNNMLKIQNKCGQSYEIVNSACHFCVVVSNEMSVKKLRELNEQN